MYINIKQLHSCYIYGTGTGHEAWDGASCVKKKKKKKKKKKEEEEKKKKEEEKKKKKKKSTDYLPQDTVTHLVLTENYLA